MQSNTLRAGAEHIDAGTRKILIRDIESELAREAVDPLAAE